MSEGRTKIHVKKTVSAFAANLNHKITHSYSIRPAPHIAQFHLSKISHGIGVQSLFLSHGDILQQKVSGNVFPNLLSAQHIRQME